MRAKSGVLIIIGLLLLVGVATAHLPDASTISTSDSWVVANGVDRTTITVTALNTTHGHHTDPVANAEIQFTVDNPIYGNVSPLIKTTDSSGEAKSTFKVNRKSGVVNITARITADGYTVVRYINVNIDHDSPYYPYFTHPLSGTVATVVPFNISITDRWGNRIDNRRGNHTIRLSVHGPAPDDCGFVAANTSQHSISSTLDSNGNTSLSVRLTTKVGPNNILMEAFGSIRDKLEWINADTTGIPVSITQIYSPSGSPPSLPADGTSIFTITYSLIDRYGNPSSQQWIWVNTSIPGEEHQFMSNSLGQIIITYGPRSSVGTINIIAKAVANTTVTISQGVEFTSTSPVNMELTANPETMASRDADPAIKANITAMVMDIMGNPVENENVTFSLGSPSYPGGPYNVTSSPSLLNTSAITDENGIARVTFIPGKFSTNILDPLYNPTATGTCTVTAHWGSTSRNILVTWKNYPYLSVITTVNPHTVGVNETVDVTIALKGDGWALTSKPADVVLVTDVSGSMNSNVGDGSGNTKIQATKNALRNFVGQGNNRTYIALASYGYSPNPGSGMYASAETIALWNQQVANSSLYPFNPYGSFYDRCLVNPSTWNFYSGYQNKNPDAMINKDFSQDKNSLNTTINAYTGLGGTDIAAGINAARQEFNTYGVSNHNWTIVIMSDGIATMAPITPTSLKSYWPKDWNTLGPGGEDQSPTAKTAAIDAASKAKAAGITIYTIGFGTIADTATLQSIASPGCYFPATNSAGLDQIYKNIGEYINQEAGVNTTMMVDFQNINVTGVTIPGDQVFSYVPHPTYSTRILWQDGVTNVTNQSADWADDHQLGFNIGTINVGKTWNATFRLRANQSGSVDIFGANSLISFNGGASYLTLPHTFLTVVPLLNVTEIGDKRITLENLLITEPGEIKGTLPVMWNTTYTGNKTITEQVYYSIDYGPWVQFDVISHDYPFSPDVISETQYVDYAQLDVRKLPPGGYKIKVYATASDAPDDEIITDAKRVGGEGKTYIKLEAPPFDFFEQNQNGTLLPQYFNQKAENPWGILQYWGATTPQ